MLCFASSRTAFPHGIPLAALLTALSFRAGTISAEIAGTRGTLGLNEAAERFVASLQLANRYPKARIVFAGGTQTYFFTEKTKLASPSMTTQNLALPQTAYSPSGSRATRLRTLYFLARSLIIARVIAGY